MVKKIISVATAFLMLCCMVPFYAFAESATCPKCGKDTLITNQDISIEIGEEVGLPLSLKRAYCSNCHYAKYEYNVLGVAGEQAYDDGDESHIINFLKSLKEQLLGKNANATKFESGGGSTSGGGTGRRPDGYADDKGSALVDKDGWPTATYTMLLDGYDTSAGCDTVNVHSTTNKTNPGSWYQYANGAFSGSNGNVSAYCAWEGGSPYVYASVSYYYVAPVTGYYTINFAPATYFSVTKDRTGKYVYKNSWSEINTFASFGIGVQQHSSSVFGIRDNTIAHTQNFSSETKYAIKGQILFCTYKSNFCLHCNSDYPYKYLSIQTSAPTLTVQDLTPSQITNNNNITINNNTWNGNIYVDNSTNLTYIYPQYTTINEKNETVTNISNTPIIYNNETKKYYTYDSVTNNYYYIYYGSDAPATPTPSPSPSPSPSPEPSETPDVTSTPTPDPDTPDVTPTPTPEPGGDSGDTMGILAVLVEIRDNMIQGFLDIKAAFVAGFAELSANFTLAIENLNVNIQNIFNKKFPDQSTPETALPSPTPSPSPAPLDPILPETQNLIIPKMNSNTFTDEHGTWVASGSSKYSDVFDFFYAFDRSSANFWETNVSPSHLQIEIPDPENYYIDGYLMRISKFNNRYAKEWTLQGSDDGKTWDDLDKQTGQNLSDMEEHKYPLTLRKAYKYYRLNMSNYASSMCSLSHFNLLGYDAKDVVTPTPSPTDPPSPSPAPDPGTDPTPVPTPGGGTVPAPGGDSNISGGDDEGLFGWLWDLLKDLVKAILKAIFKILSNILGFLIWIVERVGLLLPFLPAPAIAALGAGVVLIFVIRIIRFIRG